MNKHLVGLIGLSIVALWWSSAQGREGAMLEVNNAAIYYETAGSGQPIVFIHAGVADSRQWNHEFRHFSEHFNVIRYDLRGYGKSEPVAGEFTHLDDLVALLGHLDLSQPVILVGCSMGGGIAFDYALEHPQLVKALVMVDSAPSGLQLDIPPPAKFKLVEQADKAGQIELVAELETQIWFDGDRQSGTVDQEMRELAYEMNLAVLRHDAKKLGKRLPNTDILAVKRVAEVEIPVLAILGANDIPYMHAAAEYLSANVANIETVTLDNAAHLPNMDQPAKFGQALMSFITRLTVVHPLDP